MKSSKTHTIAIMIFAIFFILSCTNEDIEQDQNANRKSIYYSEEEIVLGTKLPNPYNIDNMKETYNDLFALEVLPNQLM